MNPHKEPTRRPQRPKRKRLTDTIVIQITTTQGMCTILDRIVKTGFFGSTRAAAAERLLSEAARDVLKENVIGRRARDGYEVFEDLSELSDIGKVPSLRLQSYLIAIQMAVEVRAAKPAEWVSI